MFLTKNLLKATIDGAMRIKDEEAIELCYYLTKYENLKVGPTAALNLCAAVKIAKQLGPGHTIATILCDYGD